MSVVFDRARGLSGKQRADLKHVGYVGRRKREAISVSGSSHPFFLLGGEGLFTEGKVPRKCPCRYLNLYNLL